MRPIHICIKAAAILFLLISFTALQAQDPGKEYKKLINEGKESLEIEEYEEALATLLKAEKLKPKDPEASNLIAQCYLNMGDDHKALPYLITAKEGGISDPDLDYNLGRAYHLAHKFPEAIAILEKYKATLKPSEAARKEHADQIIAYSKNGIELLQKPVKVKIKNLGTGVNSKFPDYVPAISADETTLLYTSRRDNTTGGAKDEADGHYHEDVYVSTKTDTVWGKSVQLSGIINTPKHDACAGISPDGQEMFVYRHTKADGGDLYISELKGTEWSAPKNLGPHINSKAWEPSASITSDEKVLFFVSNREGGMGGRDIY
ncbi:MAG: tetratricopeptide repeat protein, partial [Cytophagaceae bacterium]